MKIKWKKFLLIVVSKTVAKLFLPSHFLIRLTVKLNFLSDVRIEERKMIACKIQALMFDIYMCAIFFCIDNN